jgi:hypothetical protein
MEIRVGWRGKMKKMFKVCNMTSPLIYLYNIGMSNINSHVTWHAIHVQHILEEFSLRVMLFGDRMNS